MRLHLPAARLPDSTNALRRDVRAFLDAELGDHPPALRAKSWLTFDPEFSRKVAARGWVGMTWPKEYGGGGLSLLDRYVVIEEMLAAGAPAAAHWTGDRQSGPLLLRHGTEAQRRRFLPLICAGEVFFCIGMSEPDSGSDLASIRTRARRVDGGWRVTGTKLWTSNSHRSDFVIALVRTGENEKVKHAGLSQVLIDLSSEGISRRSIADLTGEEHFSELVLDDVFVPDDLVVGEPGNGWAQVTSELALERSGPERFMSSLPLLFAAIRSLGERAGNSSEIGRLFAHLLTLRQMSIAVATMIQTSGHAPALEAALIKDLGMDFEQVIPRVVDELLGVAATLETLDEAARMLGMVMTLAPSFSIRGGTREILRGIIAKGLGAR